MRFAREMIIDLCVTPGLSGSEVVLVDPDQDRLETVLTFAKAYAAELGVSLRFAAEVERSRALPDAQFVMCAALAGGRAAMEQDRHLLESHNYYRGIGLNTPYRQLALQLAIARDMATLCPQALHLMVANPVPESCRLITAETGVRTVGICHGFLAAERFAALLGLDPGLLECTAVGINHLIWAIRFSYDGHDIYPLLDAWGREVAPTAYRSLTPRLRNDDYQLSQVAFDLYRLYGLLPIGDTCRAIDPTTWWYHTDALTKQHWYGPTGGWDGEEGHANNLAWLRAQSEELRTHVSLPGLVTTVYPPRASRWQVVPIIDSMLNDRPSLQQVSIPNTGRIIADLPKEDCIVEAPALVDADGFHAVDQYHLPASILLGVLLPRVLLCERIVAAQRTADIRWLLQTFLSDHKTTSPDQAVAALSALVLSDEGMHEHYQGTLSFLETWKVGRAYERSSWQTSRQKDQMVLGENAETGRMIGEHSASQTSKGGRA
jgi:alpha-galactosidase